MLTNYIKIAWRNLVRDRQFTFLNLMGLSIGLSCAFLIYLWVSDERSIDKFNGKDSNLFQVMKNSPNSDGSVETHEHTQGMLAQEMVKEIPEIQYAVSVRSPGEMGVLTTGDKHIKAKWKFGDKDFFNIFSYPLLSGNKSNPLSDKYGVLVSDKLAMTLFNTTENLLGKTIAWDHGGEFNGTYVIRGVFQAPPKNASDPFDLLFPYTLYMEKEGGAMGDASYWGSNGVFTYLVLKKGVDVRRFNEKIRDFSKIQIRARYGKDNDMLHWEGDLFVRRFSDKYLYNHYSNGVQSGGRIEYVRLFSVIALFILVIACINFMNLSTAKASRRIKEVGIRKTVGARRGTLILQYMGESMLMVLLSLVIASGVVWFLLPVFEQITGKHFVLRPDLGMGLSIAGITVATGLIAGSYPALYLSGFKPALVLKGKMNIPAGESRIRRGLVIVQFVISITLIVSVLVVYQQMTLIRTRNLGYNKDNIIHFSNEGKLQGNPGILLEEMKSVPGVVGVSGMNGDLLGHAGHGGGGIDWEGKDPRLGIEYYGLGVDYGLIELMGLKMKEGRSFSRSFGSDSSSVIFNETAIAMMGLTDPVGKTVSLWGRKKQIIGVVRDYHFESLYKKVGPAFLEYFPNNHISLVKIQAGTENTVLPQLEKLYKKYNQGLSFEYRFLDDDYQALYSSEEKVAVLSRYFAGLAIIISCLGLFGLSAFTAQRRQKEIGIRKVVGASVSSIVLMLSKDFLRLSLIAVLIAFPLSWWALNRWLESFAYRVHIGMGVFVITGVATVAITLLTISFQSVKAGFMSPVNSLKSE